MINIIHNNKLHFRTGFKLGYILLKIQYDSVIVAFLFLVKTRMQITSRAFPEKDK